MAVANNPIASRVKAHKKQAKSMLTPGLGVSARAAKTGQLPAIFTHFSVGKAKEASSAMRMINHRRMGKMQVETGKSFAQAIPQKFKEVQKLLHINPSVSREETIWNEMEKTLPTQGSSVPQYEEPAQPGEMRAGSRIQKFSIMPQEGQSIASFKKQTSLLSKPKSTQQVAPQKPKVDPRARLFSRVQEVSSSQEKPVVDIPERSPEPPASVKKDTVQRQVDPATAPPKQTPVSPSQPTARQTEKTPVPEKAQTNAEIFKSLSAAMDGETVSATLELEEQKSQINLPGEPSLKPVASLEQAQPAAPEHKDVPAPKTDAPPLPQAPMSVQAKPVARKIETKQEAARPTVKALPVAKPVATTAPTVQRKTDVPAAKPTALTVQRKTDVPAAKPTAPTVQRKAVAPVSKSSTQVAQPTPKETAPVLLSKVKPEAPRAAQPEKQKQVEADIPPLVEEKVSVSPRDESSQPDSTKQTSPVKAEPAKVIPPSEMPLHRKIQARREAPKAVKALRPEMLKPAEAKPLLAPPPRPLISRQKYTRKDAAPAAPPAEEVVQRQVGSAPEVAASSTLSAEFSAMDSLLSARIGQPKAAPAAPHAAEPIGDSRQKLSMSLAKTPRIVQAAPKTSEKRPELPREKRQEEPREDERSKPEQALPAPSTRVTDNIPVSKQKVVQRQPDDDSGEIVSPPQAAPLNLNQLAEDVLPYVKRILEIESERTPGSLR